MLGVHHWTPRQPGQKGLRILSLDGGGTRGVLTIALLREVLKGFDKDVHEVGDQQTYLRVKEKKGEKKQNFVTAAMLSCFDSLLMRTGESLQ